MVCQRDGTGRSGVRDNRPARRPVFSHRVDLALRNRILRIHSNIGMADLALIFGFAHGHANGIIHGIRKCLERDCGCQQEHHQQQAEKLFAYCLHFFSS